MPVSPFPYLPPVVKQLTQRSSSLGCSFHFLLAPFSPWRQWQIVSGVRRRLLFWQARSQSTSSTSSARKVNVPCSNLT